MVDFDRTIIELRYASNAWGPFNFDCTDLIPDGESVSSVDVKAYLGILKPVDDLSIQTDVTSGLIASSDVSENVVSVRFDYNATYKGERVTLVFELTLSNGGTHPYYFHYVTLS